MTITREDVELYLMGEYDGDKAALEAAIAADPALQAMLADEAQLEAVLRDAGAAGVFCVGCDDLVGDQTRCAACGVAVKPGGYIVEEVLVSNAHGRMYVARDADGTQVALKELAFVQTPARDTIAMFEREAKFLRALEHPAIPRFRAAFEEGTGVHTRYYLAQELVTGESLADKLDDHFFTEAEIFDLGKQVLEVLVYLQSVSPMVIHRDIKPANLIAKPDGKIAVVDFGAAHVQGTTAGSTSIGTFGYMPIEQLAGQVDATTDVYALGASLIHLLSRREPWRLLQGASLEGINVSPPLRDFLSKIVATEPSHRFPNAQAALAGLDAAARGDRITPIVAPRRRRIARPALLATAAFGLAAAGYGAHALTTPAPSTKTGYGVVIAQFTPGDSAGLWIDGESYGKVGNFFTAQIPIGRHFVRIGPNCVHPIDLEEDGDEVFVGCNLSAGDLLGGTLGIEMVGRPYGELFVDDVLVDSVVSSGRRIAVPSGQRKIRIVSEDRSFCEHRIEIKPNERSDIRCELRPAKDKLTEVKHPVAGKIPPGKSIDLDFIQIPLHDVVRSVGKACNLNFVVPDRVDVKINVALKQAPCDQVLEVLLESRGLWYRYDPTGNMILIAPRHELDREVEAVAWRQKQGFVDDALPPGQELDFDFKNAPLGHLLQVFADIAGINLVLPEQMTQTVSVYMKKARWDIALTTVLEANGLGYRYRPSGKILRIAPRHVLDREAEEQQHRDQKTK